MVTGAASGIGRALAHRFADEGPEALIVSDRDAQAVQAVADAIGAHAVVADVGSLEGVRGLISDASKAHGPIEVFFSNAGIGGPPGLGDFGGATDGHGLTDAWQRTWDVNVMSHVWAAQLLVPGMVERGEGYLLSTASAAGLLTQVSAPAYSVTKHGAVAFAEWLAIMYGDAGVRVSCLCPQGVRTPLLDEALEDPVGAAPLLAGGLLDPSEVAEVCVEAIRDERFLILPHPEVADFFALRAAQHPRWLAGMRKLVRQARQAAGGGPATG